MIVRNLKKFAKHLTQWRKGNDMRHVYCVNIEFLAGTDIKEAINIAKIFLLKNDVRVNFNFNGFLMEITDYQIFDEVYIQKYHDWIQEKNTNKEYY